MRNKAIFAGTSNTMGLGLELEFSERYQDEYFLENICKEIPPRNENKRICDRYSEEDILNHRKYRWPTLVSNHFGVEQLNINDPINPLPFGWITKNRQAVDLIFSLNDYKDSQSVKDFLSEVKYIFLEFGYIRWWDKKLHGVNSGFEWPSTPTEIQNFLDDPTIDLSKKEKAIDWLNEINPIELWKQTLYKIKEFKNNFTDIKVFILSWGVSGDIFNLDLTNDMIDSFIQMPNKSYDIQHYLYITKQTIFHNVLAYNKKYKSKWLYKDLHANSKGHEVVAKQIIKKIENYARTI